MEENFEQDYVSQFIDNVLFVNPCDNCNDKAECTYDNKSNSCDKRFYKMLKAERIA